MWLENLKHLIKNLFQNPPPPELTEAQLMEKARETIEERRREEERLRSKKDKPRYSEARANEVLHLLERLPVGHPLYNLSFHKQTLINHPALAGLLTELVELPAVLREENQQTLDVFLKKLRDVVILERDLRESASSDLGSLLTLRSRIEERIDLLRQRVVPDERQAEFNERLRELISPPQRNEPPKKEETRVVAKEWLTPLDFTGHYSPPDPRMPQRLREIVDQVNREIADARANNRESSFDAVEYEGQQMRFPALERLEQDLLDAMRQSQSDPRIPPEQRLYIQDVWPYLRRIHQHITEIKRAKGLHMSRQLEAADEKILRKAAEDAQKGIEQGGITMAQRNMIYEQIFYKLLTRVLSKHQEEWTRSFGLYENEAMNEFFDIISEYEGGYAEVSRFVNKMYGIFAAHDAIRICEHPEGHEEHWKALTTFARNSYTADMMADPIAVSLINLYERVLWDILRTFNGHIPASWVEPTEKGRFVGNSLWDEMVWERFMQLVDSGVIYDAKRNPKTGEIEKDSLGRVILDRENPLKRSYFDGDGRWRLMAAMRLAKGFGVLDARLLEIFALQRVPAWGRIDMPEVTDVDKVFASVPYEGMARYINPAHLMYKWGVSDERFRYYWNLLIWEGEEGREQWFDPAEAEKVFRSVENGTFEEEYPEFAQRLLQKYTWGMFSGRFGPWSFWGIRDAIIGLNDKEREYLGGAVRIGLNGVWAEEDIKEFLVEKEFKERYRRELKVSGKYLGDEWFEKEWKKIGKSNEPRQGIYTIEIRHKWRELKENPKTKKEIEALKEELTNLYNTQVWIQWAVRSPHIVARNTFIYEDYLGKLRKRSLRDKILEEVFPNLDMEQFYTAGGGYTENHERWFREQIAVLEGDIDVVAHAALYDPAGPREIKEEDFNKIVARRADGSIDEAETLLRRKRAQEYCRKVQRAILGAWDLATWERELGLSYVNGRLTLDWEKIWDSKKFALKRYEGGKTYLQRLLEKAKEAAEHDVSARPYFQLDEELLAKKNYERYLLSTEDVAWDKLELINLGYRHWARRGGDFEGHAKGLKAEMDYITWVIGPHFNKERIVEHLTKIAQAYSMDDKWYSFAKVGLHLEATEKFYKKGWLFSKTGLVGMILDLFLPSSAAQRVSRTKIGVSSLLANDLFDLNHAVEAAQLLPARNEGPLEEGPFPCSIEEIEERVGATPTHVIWEIITLTATIAFLIQLYRSLTAPDEESEGGGGGGHGH